MSILSPSELEQQLRTVGEERYHIHHPFHKMMNAGELSKVQMQAWALNRYCYQAVIPKKDAIILSKSDDPAFRREWRERIFDHDGKDGAPGGMAKWLRRRIANPRSPVRVRVPPPPFSSRDLTGARWRTEEPPCGGVAKWQTHGT